MHNQNKGCDGMDTNQAQYTAVITPEEATNQSVTWSIENITGEAVIDITGLVTTVSPGTIRVIAAANDGSGVTGDKEVLITEDPILAESIAVQGPSAILFTT